MRYYKYQDIVVVLTEKQYNEILTRFDEKQLKKVKSHREGSIYKSCPLCDEYIMNACKFCPFDVFGKFGCINILRELYPDQNAGFIFGRHFVNINSANEYKIFKSVKNIFINAKRFSRMRDIEKDIKKQCI